MKILITLLVLLMAGFSYGQVTYVVTGAGSEECNGEYVADVEVNGKMSYKYEGSTTFYLYCDSYEEYWCISTSTSDDYDNSYYYVYSTDDTPPSTGWEYYWGYDPAPTVILKAPTLIYSSNVFYESDENDGTISNSLTITYSYNESDSFSGSNGTFSTSNYTTSNVPDGLTVVITRNSDTELSVALTGTASSHTNTQDVSTMEIAFNNSAFTGGDASAVTNATKSDIEVDFFQDYYVAASGGDFTSITEAVAAADDRDIINIAAGTYTESGISIIEKELTILGAGAATTIIQASATANTASDRIFRIEASTIKIKDITIQNGKVTGVGAGIYPSSTNLTLENVALLNNTATLEGGAVRLLSSTVSIKNCTFAGNSTGQYGGGISCNGGVTTISNTTIAENSASLYGGAIFIQGESISIINSTIANNTTGGICFNSGTLSISNTILANNTSSDYYFLNVGTLNDNGYNIVENQSSSGATGTWYFHQPTDILYSRDYLGNTEGASGLGWNRNDASIPGDLNLSSTLADNNTTNGTQTLALTSGSFAIDAGTDTDAPTRDQRGVSRKGTTDIGAYEYDGEDASLPVDLSSFSAVCEGQSVILEWVTESETDNLGFILERAISRAQNSVPLQWTTIASYQTNDALNGQGNTSSKTEYFFTDTEVEPGMAYEYRLSDVSTDGKIAVYTSLSIVTDALPEVTEMEKAYPNPFNPSTFISYHLAEDGQVEISVYDMLGRKVQTLFNGQQLAGSYQVYWNGKSYKGNIASTGTYLIRMQTENTSQVQKVLLMK